MDVLSYLWLGAAIVAAVVEAAVPSLVSIWFVPGALAALIASLLNGPLWLQILLFAAVSAAALALTRPLAARLQSSNAVPTNADMAVGRQAVVTEDLNDLLGTGRVEVRGKSWAARSENGAPIPRGRTVTVLRIEGVKLIVTEEKKS